jgi:mitochondrial fission protein ELM1
MPPTAWIISTGKTGHDVKGLGVAQALGLDARLRVIPRFPMGWLAPRVPLLKVPGLDGPPWPDVVFGSGRRTAPFVTEVKRRSGGRSFAAFFDHPGRPPSDFDFVWLSAHDSYDAAPNTLQTLTAPHRLTPDRLEQAAVRVEETLGPRAGEGGPLVGVLLGGTSNAFTFGKAEGEHLGRQLAALQSGRGATLLVTGSRRTDPEALAALTAAVDSAHAFVYEASAPNAYPGILGLADAFVVTCDSANMIGEAAMTGRPIHAVRLPGGSKKFDTFFDGMIAAGAMRWFDGTLGDWTYAPIDSTPLVAEAIRQRLPPPLAERLTRSAPPDRP